ncbi:MAG: hypothetical protein KatS3mg051_0865 [Anaerolineae bacterium]|nr:MAG: hypothetical protein KatS3mg051_0865 [Anaerolineae bacterium]
MYVNTMRVGTRTAFWQGPDLTPPTVIDNTDPGWDDDAPTYVNRRFDANAVTALRVEFLNGPLRLSDYFVPGRVHRHAHLPGHHLGRHRLSTRRPTASSN